MPGLFRDQGYDLGALTVVFRAMGVTKHRQAFYMPRAAAVIGVIQQIRKKKNG